MLLANAKKKKRAKEIRTNISHKVFFMWIKSLEEEVISLSGRVSDTRILGMLRSGKKLVAISFLLDWICACVKL